MALPSLDVLISLVTVYIVLAITVSAITSLTSQVSKLRSKGLRDGIRGILQDPLVSKDGPLVQAFWANPIVQSATNGVVAQATHLDALTFATGTLSAVGAVIPHDIDDAETAIDNISESVADDHVKKVLKALARRAFRRGTTLHDELAQHFDAVMAKMSKWYERKTKFIALFAAAFVTILLHADSLAIWKTLTANTQARLELAQIRATLHKPVPQISPANADPAKAPSTQETAKAAQPGDDTSSSTVAETGKAGGAATPASPPKSAQRADGTADPQASDDLPTLPKDVLGDWPHPGPLYEWVYLIIGLAITTLAVSLGAPFWFNVLGRLTQGSAPTDQPPSSISAQPTAPTPSPDVTKK